MQKSYNFNKKIDFFEFFHKKSFFISFSFFKSIIIKLDKLKLSIFVFKNLFF